MPKDLFLSRYSRADLADYYSSFYKDLHGYRPEITPDMGRVKLVDLIEQLEVELAEQEWGEL